MGRSDKKKKKQPPPKQHPTNIWDAVVRSIELAHNLVQTGQIIGLAVMFFLAWVMFVTFKLPPASLDGYIGQVINFFSSEKYYIFPLSISLAFSVVVNVTQRKTYREDIRRLKDVRGLLMHGLEGGDLKHLEEHNSCDLEIEDV